MARYKKNEWRARIGDGAILVKLTQNKVAIVDQEDWEHIKKYTWCAMHTGRSGGVVAVSNTFGRQVYMHRVIIGAIHGDGQIVDHINHNRLDNRRSNLRLANPGQSARNRRKGKRKGGSTSIYKGVSWDREAGRWRTQCMKQGKHYRLGFFDSEIEAARAYNGAAIELHGEFASLNVIEE